MSSNSVSPIICDPALDAMVDAIQQARASQRTLRIAGGHSKAFLADQPTSQKADAVLNTQAYAGITCYDPSELFVTAKAGTLLCEVEAALAAEGQCLAFEPPHFTHAAAAARATIGGAVACGLSGPARASVGALRDYVLGAHIVNGKGELLAYGGQVMKNVAGYDLSRLVAGSWGQLALIAEVTLKVMPVAAAEATLCFTMAQDHALAMLNRWCGQPLPINASSWQLHDGEGMLFLRLRGAEAAVTAASKMLAAQHGGSLVAPHQAVEYWNALRNQTCGFFTDNQASDPGMVLWRVSVPQTSSVLDGSFPQLIEWHGGLRWLWAPAHAEPARQILALAHAAGGHARVFVPARHSPLDRVPSSTALTPGLLRIHQRLKAAFDPDSVFASHHSVF